MEYSKVFSVICSLFISITVSFAQINGNRTIKNKCTYIEEHAINDSTFWFPKNLSMNQLSVIKDAESATIVAYVYVANLYGKEIAQREQPYHVTAVNDSLWMISGTSKLRKKRKRRKGNFYIIINKDNGRIISCLHDK